MLPEPGSGRYQAWASYVYSYLEYQARRERSTKSYPGRVYRAAEAIHDQDRLRGNRAGAKGCDTTEPPPKLLRALVALAANSDGGDNLRRMIRAPSDLFECSEDDVQTDIHIASIYLGRTPYIADLIATSNLKFFHGEDPANDNYSNVFGGALQAAAVSGDLSMIKLLLGPGSTGISCFDHTTQSIKHCIDLHKYKCYCRRPQILAATSAAHSHREALEFSLPGLLNHPDPAHLARLYPILDKVPWPDIHDLIWRSILRTIAQTDCLGPNNLAMPLLSQTDFLAQAAGTGRMEMARSLIAKGAELEYRHHSPWPRKNVTPVSPLAAAVGNRDEEMTRLLLASGADPNWTLPWEWTALMTAARKCSVPIARLLLDKGADVNAGGPVPIVLAVFHRDIGMFRLLRQHGARLDTAETGGLAMAIARMEGSWMVDVLMAEGVDRDSWYLHWTYTLMKEYSLLSSGARARGLRGVPENAKHWFVGDHRPWN